MKLLGIDPGPAFTALVVWDGISVLHSETIPSSSVIALWPDCDEVACEHLQCFGMAVGKEVFETAYWIGTYRHHCELHGIPFHRIYRTDEKMQLCHHTKATDANIRQAIIDLFGGKDFAIGKKKTPGPLYGICGDLWSALAVALTYTKMKGGKTLCEVFAEEEHDETSSKRTAREVSATVRDGSPASL